MKGTRKGLTRKRACVAEASAGFYTEVGSAIAAGEAVRQALWDIGSYIDGKVPNRGVLST
jgi:hypothetical protein